MRQNPDYLLREAADTTVILPVGRAAAAFPGMISVNETGRLLWELLAEEQSAETLAQALCLRYGAEPDRARADVERFLARLRLAGAILE